MADSVFKFNEDGHRAGFAISKLQERVSMPEVESAETPDWRDAIFAVLKAAEIRQVGYVPDAGHARLIQLCRDDPVIRAVPLTSEEEGVALLAGAWLGGQRGALLMQSSGVGNCINTLAMTKTCRFPLAM